MAKQEAPEMGARMVVACTSGDEATVRKLLRETPSLARQVLVGPLSPLHYAVREGHAGIVQHLLEHGADAHVVVEPLCRLPLRTVEATRRCTGRRRRRTRPRVPGS
jgi:hypothetical protein